jgi:arylsulfatase A-like enzyme/glycosyltransferase involved in cell wall biosynthesis
VANSLTVLICTHNRASLLQRALGSLNSARRPAGWQVSVLVVANACTDGTHALLDAARTASNNEPSRLSLNWLAEPRPGKSFALNTAIPRAQSSDVVTFVDDDHRVDENYLVEICRAAETYPEITMFCGRILPEWDGTEPRWVHDEGPYRIRPLPIPRSDGGPKPRELTSNDATPGGGNLFLRGNVFDRAGEFPTELGPRGHDLGGGEDSVFVERALSRGERLMYVPGVLQYHYVDPERLNFTYVLRKAYQRARTGVMPQRLRTGIPLYQWRKLGQYLLALAFAFGGARLRFYLVRIATTLGEMAGQRATKWTPAIRPAEKRRNRIYLAAIGIVAGGGMATALAQDKSNALVGVTALATAALIFTCALGIKSIADFTHTGPRLRDEILKHYQRYTVFAFLRLLCYAFVLQSILASLGVLTYFALIECLGGVPSFGFSLAAGSASILLLTGLQFSRHLLWLPANIAASYNYRLSRLYPFWRTLSPTGLQVATWVLLGAPTALISATIAMLLMKGEHQAAIAFGSALLFFATLGMWLRTSEPLPKEIPRRTQRPNILLLGSDTLRADRIDGTYGREVSPFLKSMAGRGTLFSQCYVPCARTAPSLLSLLTGCWPHRFGVRDNFVPDEGTRLPVDTLPHILKQHGYYTAALGDWCGADMGKFDLGFDYADVPEDQWNIKLFIRQGPKDLRLFLSLFARNRFGKISLPEIYYLGGVPQTDEIGLEARHLISHLAAQGQPFFLNVFFSTTHGPFGSEYPYYSRFAHPDYQGESKFVMARVTDPWEIIRRQAEPRESFDLDQIINLYDGCVARFDDEVKRIMDHLDHCGLAENTIVVVYSDHGMEFFEHQTWGQGNSATSDVSNRIPLLIHVPGGDYSHTITQPIRNIDLMPTLLELVGIDLGPKMDGVSLQRFLQVPDIKLELDVYSETGIWLTELPGTPAGHLRYPNLLELLTVRDIATGTISLKPEYEEIIVRAKDRMIRHGRWKLVYQPLNDGYLLKLYDLEQDPHCLTDVSADNPFIVSNLWHRLQTWISAEARVTERNPQLSLEADN